MENEDKIVELLAESLKNQDIQSEKLNRVSDGLETVNNKLDEVVDVVKDLGNVLKSQVSVMERLISKYDKVDALSIEFSCLKRN